jgi:hypothetical protein
VPGKGQAGVVIQKRFAPCLALQLNRNKNWQYRKNRQKVFNAKTERGKDAKKNPLLLLPLCFFALFFSEFCSIVKIALRG